MREIGNGRIRALAGLNRLCSLAPLAHLSTINEATGDGTPAQSRNLHTIAMLMIGVMRELATVLNDLRGAGIRTRLDDPAPWSGLEGIRKRWFKEPAVKMRNGVAFHLGDKTQAVRGLAHVQALTDSVPFCRLESRHPNRAQFVEAHYPLGDAVLMAAVGLESKEVWAVLDDVKRDSSEATRLLHMIWLDLLRQCGANIELA